MKKVLFSLAALAALSSAVFAGSTSATVPVTINYEQGCAVTGLNGTYDFGAVPAVMEAQGMMLTSNPVAFNVACSNGLAYKIKSDGDNFTMQPGGASSSRINLELYDNGDKTKKITTGGYDRVGTGVAEAVNLVPFVYPNSGCTNVSGTTKSICQTGTLQAIVNLTIAW